VPGFALRVYTGCGRRHAASPLHPLLEQGRDSWITTGHHGTAWRPDARGNPRTLTAERAREEALRFRGVWQSGGNPRAARGRPLRRPGAGAAAVPDAGGVLEDVP